ncbi:MAG: beta-ketoacyl-ACP synthase III [bacterium]|uniref:Beta-ketoacyl-[acyl-carrier-protein] synthase III n=2 Tax=Bacteria candidate phyla TaxID=1783234 RepID=A0A101I4D7_UNCT6|nr:MAG: 3-oxoacyl-[acyl-carrier-protein] synthase 3 [candidate division TA06 bacterium 32_111]KUK88063.1 MAG: 3-oxoacyl-[acyl-carrier-protein] synthase 3 [candidate division TA06 bacterium 34_109]MDI6700869.1 beta-ketoacyl-ACP synthase III [bacterium]HAF06995.1 3-oxoacyl-ACP synthase [candidate division WOR-3 bacterium]HCP16909.1 3-oxoacyl-ACP synthase [candidate division WOR-3 bacterium]
METKLKSVGIVGTGFYVPEKVLTNFDLEKMVDTTDEWIRTRTGIKERRIASDKEAASDLAIKASNKSLEDAKIYPAEIDLIIVATLSSDMLFPSTACLVQKNIGAVNAVAFDLEAACSGFIYGLSIAQQYLQNGTYKTALVIGAEIFSRILDWQDRNTCVLFGDGAGAVVLKEVEEGSGILSTYLGADGSGADLLRLPAGGSRLPPSHETINRRLHYIKTNGREVYKFATKSMVETVMKGLSRVGLSTKNIDLLIPHQANIRIIECVAEKLGLPMEKVFVNVDRYGNTSAASIPIALSEALQQGRIKKNDIVILVSFGAGLTYGATIIKR